MTADSSRQRMVRPENTGDLPASAVPRLNVVVEIPRWSFVKRGSSGTTDFVSPIPCPYNYGSVPGYLGLDGDLLDALVLGPRLPAGTQVDVRAYGAIGLADRGLYDDKLICGVKPPNRFQRLLVILFFRLYGRAKGLLNLLRGRPGRTAFVGWFPPDAAIDRAEPLRPTGPRPEKIPF